jgi:hypothetical protein
VERKSDETKGKTERKEGNREDIHRQEREIQKKLSTIAKEKKRKAKK